MSSTTTITLNPRDSMFVSIKKKLSRRGSNPLSSSKTSTVSAASANRNLAAHRSNSNNPFSNLAPATRRPVSSRSAANVQPSEPPPAYTPGPAAPLSAPAAAVDSTADDKFAFLKSFDTIFLIDDSGSMAGRSWRETENALKLITDICTKHDPDGIDIYFLNHPDSDYYKNVSHEDTVVEIFKSVRPSGGTPTGQRLNKILRPYVKRYLEAPEEEKPRPINIIVITDGEPSDDVESPIINAAKKLDKADAPAWQVGIQFFQVGREPNARAALKQLDDGLAEVAGDDDLRDIVDTVPFKGADNEELTGEGVLKVVLGSVNRRLDRNSKELHRKR